MAEKVTLGLFALIALDLIDILLFHQRLQYNNTTSANQQQRDTTQDASTIFSADHDHTQIESSHETRSRGRTMFTTLFVQAKGVAGLGKAGGDGQGGSDKAGQQVPPEVYNALTYAGTAFLFTLSVPLILYGLNKLFNRIQDCLGCGPSSRRKALEARKLKKQKSFEQPITHQHHPQPNHNPQTYQQQQQYMYKQSKQQSQQQQQQQHEQHHQHSQSSKLQSQILDPSSLMMMSGSKDGSNINYSNNIDNNTNNNNSNLNNISPPIQAIQQQLDLASSQSNSNTFNLPFDLELNQKLKHQETRQPYIISTPHL